MFTVKLQYQPIQVKAWEAYKQVGGTLYINNSLAAKYGNKKHSGNTENLSEKKYNSHSLKVFLTYKKNTPPGLKSLQKTYSKGSINKVFNTENKPVYQFPLCARNMGYPFHIYKLYYSLALHQNEEKKEWYHRFA